MVDIIDPVKVDERISIFKGDLQSTKILDVMRKHISLGESFVLGHEIYTKLKNEVASHFSVNPTEIIMVGSGKLGFSISPRHRYRHFGEDSDIDLAIVSDILFDDFWHRVLEYYDKGGYWQHRDKFQQYLFYGWIRLTCPQSMYHFL